MLGATMKKSALSYASALRGAGASPAAAFRGAGASPAAVSPAAALQGRSGGSRASLTAATQGRSGGLLYALERGFASRAVGLPAFTSATNDSCFPRFRLAPIGIKHSKSLCTTPESPESPEPTLPPRPGLSPSQEYVLVQYVKLRKATTQEYVKVQKENRALKEDLARIKEATRAMATSAKKQVDVVAQNVVIILGGILCSAMTILYAMMKLQADQNGIKACPKCGLSAKDAKDDAGLTTGGKAKCDQVDTKAEANTQEPEPKNGEANTQEPKPKDGETGGKDGPTTRGVAATSV